MPLLHGLVLSHLLSRFRNSEIFWGIALVLFLSTTVDAASFGRAAPGVLYLQQIANGLSAWAEATFGPMLGQALPAGLRIPPELLMGGGAALGLDLFRSRPRARERSRSN